MLDIQFIRDNAELVKEKSAQKTYPVNIDHLLELDVERKTKLTQIEELRRRRNEQAASLKNGKPTDEQIANGRQLKDEVASMETDLARIDEQYYALLKSVPNMPTDDVPVGASEDENVVVRQVGAISEFDFTPKSHWELGEARGFIDKERAAKVAGSRFAYVKGDLVQLHYALINFAMSVLTNEDTLKRIADDANLTVSTKPFELVMPPLMIKTDVYDAMDRLEPRDDRYKIEGEELYS